MQKNLLLIRSGYPSKEFALKILKDMGYFIVILDYEKTCPDKYADDWIFADPTDNTASINAVKKYLKKSGKRLDGAVTFWEEAVLTTAALTQEFGWKGTPIQVAKVIKNKYVFRKFCEKYGFPTPKYHYLKKEEDFLTIKKNLTFPVVIKPVYGAASAFVMRINSLTELRKAYKSINRSIKSFWLAPEWESIDLFVEEYIPGQEVDIDLLLQDGRCIFSSISDNFQTQEPYFIETGQAIPSSLPALHQQALLDMALGILKKAGFKNGCIHFEAKMSPQGPVPIEINLRMGGDEVHSFIREAWGVDLVQEAAKIALGIESHVVKPEKPIKYLEGRYFLPKESGTLKEIRIPDSVYTNANLFDLHITKSSGEIIKLPPEDYDYFGWITVKAESAKQARRALEKIFPKVRFILDLYESTKLQNYI